MAVFSVVAVVIIVGVVVGGGENVVRVVMSAAVYLPSGKVGRDE